MEKRKPKTELVVDDDATARLLLKHVLVSEGFEVLEASDGRQALERFEAERPDLLLVDIEMPELDGLSVCWELRRLDPEARVPVMIVSGVEDTDAIHRAYELGVTDFVIKPVNVTLLVERVKALFKRQRAEQQAQRRRASDALIDTLPDQVLVVDATSTVLDVAGGPLPGLADRPETLLGRSVVEFCPEHVAQLMLGQVRRALRSRESTTHTFEYGSGGAHRHCESRCLPQGRNRVLLILRDITAEKDAEARREQLALTDPLTGLANRVSLVHHLEDALSRAKLTETHLAVVQFDLGNLQKVNERYGRAAGDEILKQIAARLGRRLRDEDYLARGEGGNESGLARVGGDEFVTVLTGLTDAVQATRVAERLREEIARPVELEGWQYSVDPQVGVAVFPQDGDSVEALLAAAEGAVYRPDAGENGAGDAGRRAGARERQLREDEVEELRWALEQGQLKVHYQPTLDINDRRCSGVEALLRWVHPLRGVVPVEQFLPLAEDSGLIVEIGRRVLEEAIPQLKAWHQCGFEDLRLSVNLSSRQLVEEHFVDEVLALLEATGLDGSCLEFDLDERALSGNAGRMEAVLGELASRSIRLTVDDFGTGVSSLMVMQRLPIHSLKIDRSLVAALPGDPNSLAVAGAVIDVAHRFGALAVAEGVETQAQVDLLVAERCDQMQGFLFSHPLPAEEIGAYLERTLRTESTAVMRIIKASEKAADDAVPAQKGRRKAAGGGSAA